MQEALTAPHIEPLTEAQQELYDWLVTYITEKQHSPSIRQMMRAMNLKSPAPIQSRLEYLRKKGYIDWEDGLSRTIKICRQGGEMMFVPTDKVQAVREILGAVA